MIPFLRRRLLMMVDDLPHSGDKKLWIMPVILELFAFPFAWISVQMLHDREPWKAIIEFAFAGIALGVAGVVWAVFRKRIAALRPWLLGRWRAPKALAAALTENASLKEQLDISRRENLGEKSETSKAKECYRQCKEEKEVLSIQIAELKANGGQLSLPAPAPQSTLVKPKHNVEWVGFTLFTNDDFITATFCFRNVPNGKLLGKFEMPRLRVLYYDHSTGEEIADIFPTEWWSESGHIPPEIGTQERYALVGLFFRGDGTWKAVQFDDSDDLDSMYKVHPVELHAGAFHIKASLSGTNNVRIMPVEGILTLGEDGTASFQRLSN
jgi:hypothetical protein